MGSILVFARPLKLLWRESDRPPLSPSMDTGGVSDADRVEAVLPTDDSDGIALWLDGKDLCLFMSQLKFLAKCEDLRYWAQVGRKPTI
jgi:hypothetical protein